MRLSGHSGPSAGSLPPAVLLKLLLIPQLDPEGAWVPPASSHAASVQAEAYAGARAGHTNQGLNLHGAALAQRRHQWFRFEAAMAAIQLLRTGGVQGRAALHVMSELRAATSRWGLPLMAPVGSGGDSDGSGGGGGSVAGAAAVVRAANDAAAGAEVAAVQLKAMAFECLPLSADWTDHICRQPSGPAATAASTAATAHATSLELVPALVTAARWVAHAGANARRAAACARGDDGGGDDETGEDGGNSGSGSSSSGGGDTLSLDRHVRDLFMVMPLTSQEAADQAHASSQSGPTPPADRRLWRRSAEGLAILPALVTLALELAALPPPVGGGGPAGGRGVVWGAGQWAQLRRCVFATITASDLARGENAHQLVVRDDDVPGLARMCVQVATRAAASLSSSVVPKAAGWGMEEAEEGDEEQEEQEDGEGEDEEEDEEGGEGQDMGEADVGSMDCDINTLSQRESSGTGTSSTTSAAEAAEAWVMLLVWLLRRCAVSAERTATLEYLLLQALPLAPTVTQYLIRYVQSKWGAGGGGSGGEDGAVGEGWLEVVILLLLLRTLSPLAVALSTSTSSGGLGMGLGGGMSGGLGVGATSGGLSGGADVDGGFGFDGDGGGIGGGVGRLLPLQADSYQQLQLIFLNTLVHVGSQQAGGCANGTNLPLADVAEAAANVARQALTLNIGDVRGGCDGSSSSSGDGGGVGGGGGDDGSGSEFLSGGTEMTSPRLAALASQVVAIALGWALEPDGGTHKSNHAGGLVGVFNGYAGTNLVRQVVGRRLLCMVFKVVPQVRSLRRIHATSVKLSVKYKVEILDFGFFLLNL